MSKLVDILKIEATLVCVSGLHIGSGDTEMHIGGIDNPIIKNPISQKPYIPGSSLKGKMRSLLEWRSGCVQAEPLSIKDYENNKDNKDVVSVLKLFGISGDTKMDLENLGDLVPGRLSFWDCSLNKEWEKMALERALSLTEVKSENTIDRISGTAKNPRFSERVPAGAKFNFNLSLKVLDTDNKDELLNSVFVCMQLLMLDALGGSGSRGYGKIAFENVKVSGEDYQALFDSVKPFEK